MVKKKAFSLSTRYFSHSHLLTAACLHLAVSSSCAFSKTVFTAWHTCIHPENTTQASPPQGPSIGGDGVASATAGDNQFLLRPTTDFAHQPLHRLPPSQTQTGWALTEPERGSFSSCCGSRSQNLARLSSQILTVWKQDPEPVTL